MLYILFVLGFVALIKGADILVVGSSSIAKKFNVSDLVIGLTIVSIGTSMPELIVNILASVSGSSDIAMGNVVGSNIANILLILGIAAIIYPLTIKDSTVLSEIPYSIIALLLVAFLANTAVFDSNADMLISQLDGGILLLFFGLFSMYILKLVKDGRAETPSEDVPEASLTMGKAALYIVLGIIALFFGGKWVVDGAVQIAAQLGLSERLIGLTIVAVGTSLPELVTSAVAAYRKNTDIAVANVIGSNIFNILWILGISALMTPLDFDLALNVDFIVLLVATCLIIFSLMTGKAKNVIGRPTGIFFLLCYAAYVAFLVWRG